MHETIPFTQNTSRVIAKRLPDGIKTYYCIKSHVRRNKQPFMLGFQHLPQGPQAQQMLVHR